MANAYHIIENYRVWQMRQVRGRYERRDRDFGRGIVVVVNGVLLFLPSPSLPGGRLSSEILSFPNFFLLSMQPSR